MKGMCFGRKGVAFTQKGVAFSEILVVKIGGSSLSTAEKIRHAGELITDKAKQGTKVVVVVSAMGKTTDELIDLLNNTNSIINGEYTDEILSMGERTSARVFTSVLLSLGVKAGYLDVVDGDWPVLTDGKHSDANILVDETKRRIQSTVRRRLQDVNVLVVPGFIGKAKNGKVTTIGRGGSDATAFLIGGAVEASKIVLISDVRGIMSADPRIIENAKRLGTIRADKLVGLADSGTKFIHKKTLKYKPAGIDVRLISNESKSLDEGGTIIRGGVPNIAVESPAPSPIYSITIIGDNISANPDILAGMMEVFKEVGVSLFGVSANHDNLVLYCKDEKRKELLDALHSVVLGHEECNAIATRGDLSMVEINGIGLQETPGSIARASESLTMNGINIYGQFTVMSEIFFLVKSEELDIAKKLISEALEVKK